MKPILSTIGGLIVAIGAGTFFGGLVWQSMGFSRKGTVAGAALVILGITLIFVS